MMIEEVVGFLKTVPPFQFLADEDLKSVAATITMEFYPRDTLILKQDGTASDALRIIKKGGVQVSMRTENGENVVIDQRGEGETFGLVSLIGKDRQKTSVIALEDTICYLVGREKVMELIDTRPAFTEYFLQTHFEKYIEKTYREMHTKSLFSGGSDRLLFTTRIGDLAGKKIVSVAESTSIREAAQVMSESRVSSVVVIDRAGLPSGIVTDRDLREKVVAKGRDAGEPVKNIMSTSLIRVDARDYCFEAVLKMIKYNIHHILVIREGSLAGVITNHDLMLLQGTSPLSLTKDIESRQTIEELIPVSGKINGIVGLLLQEGARASNIIKVITEINDRLVRKILEIAGRKFGPPPLDYCWIVFGSEGRKEQTFKTDQDNALIYADPGTPEEARAAEAYFERFCEFVNGSIMKCGFPPCPGGYMASNPVWRQPLGRWKEYFRDWIYTPTPDAILASVILFDFRPVYGASALGEALRDHLHETLRGHELFLKQLAQMAIRVRPPLGFFKTFVVEKTGEHKDELNLKFKCLAPFVDIVRLYSLETGTRETPTLERIEALKERHRVVTELGDEMESVFDFLTLLRIHHQYEQVKTGKIPDNFVNPDALTNLEKRTLKGACGFITRMQDAAAKEYSPGTVM